MDQTRRSWLSVPLPCLLNSTMPFAPVNGIQLYYEVHGSGPAILFAHGQGGNHLSWWRQVPYFARHYTCITFDHRAFGQSLDLDGQGRRGFGQDAIELLDHLGHRRHSHRGPLDGRPRRHSPCHARPQAARARPRAIRHHRRRGRCGRATPPRRGRSSPRRQGPGRLLGASAVQGTRPPEATSFCARSRA